MMERASQALVRMDYLTCEAICLEALALARERRDWWTYARILLPLQEARRQRRIIASEGRIRLGTATLAGALDDWLDQMPAGGCVALTAPHTIDDARRLHDLGRERRRHVEVLFAEPAADDGTWTLRSYVRPDIATPFAAPPAAWRDRWLESGEVPADENQRDALRRSATPADWFLDACEALGDAALASVAPADAGRIEVLEGLLEVAPDHEILHQRLGDAARAQRLAPQA